MANSKKTVQEPVVKPWGITQADIEATTDVEFAWGTMRCLPAWDIIPVIFKEGFDNTSANIYIKMADAMFCGDPLPSGDVVFNEGFEPSDTLMKFIMAHMKSFAPNYEHKIAGIAYMISIIVAITPENSNGN